MSITGYSIRSCKLSLIANQRSKIPLQALNGRTEITIQNLGSSPIFIGGYGVECDGVNQGVVLPNKYSSISLNIRPYVDLYGICAVDTNLVILEGA